MSLRFLCGCFSPGSAVGQGLRPFVVYPPSCRGGGFYTTQYSAILKFFHGNNGWANAAECNVRTLPILFIQRPSLLENFKE